MTQGFGRGRNSVPQTLALWFGLAALIIQGFVPLGLGAMAGPDGQSVVICTARGMETVRIDADGKPISGRTSSSNHGSPCSVCSDCQAAGAFTLPSPILASRPVEFVDAVLATASLAAPISRAHLPYVSRAPPSLG